MESFLAASMPIFEARPQLLQGGSSSRGSPGLDLDFKECAAGAAVSASPGGAADPPRKQATPIRIEQILYARVSAFESGKDRTIKPFAITGIRWDPAEAAQFRVTNPFMGTTALWLCGRG